MAANVSAQRDPDLAAYYEKKRAEGKHHNTCIVAVSRKLCYILHTILTENRAYVIRESLPPSTPSLSQPQA